MPSDADLDEAAPPERAAAAPLVLILCGHCGVGKSSAGNLLIGEHRFAAQRSAAAVTSECRREQTVIDGRELYVIDTPGLADPEVNDSAIHTEIIRGIAAAATDLPDAEFAVALVMSLASRVDESVIDAFKELKRTTMGVGMYPQSLTLWTHGDLLSATHPAEAEAAPSTFQQVPLSFCGECGHKSSGTRFCTACGASLLGLPPSPLPTGSTAAAPQAALDGYLATAGDEVRSFLSLIRGRPVVLSNPLHAAEQASTESNQLARVLESAAAVAGPAAMLAPPKKRGKVARRERQLALAQAGRVGRAIETPAKPQDEVDASTGASGLIASLSRWWFGSGAEDE